MRIFFIVMCFFVYATHAQMHAYTPEIKNTYEAGLVAYSNNEHTEAQVKFEAVLKLDSTCYEAHYMRALIFYEQAAFQEALAVISLLNTYRPFDPQTLALEGRTRYQLNMYILAENLLKRAISLGQTAEQNQYYLALSLNENQHFDESLFYFNELLTLDAEVGQYWTGRGNVYLNKEEYELALSDYQQSLKIDSSQLETRIALIQLLNHLNRVEESKTCILQGLVFAKGTDRLPLLLLAGDCYRNQGHFDESKKAFSSAFAIDSLNPIVLTYQSSLLIDLEEFDNAVLKCNAALEIDPTLTEAYFNRGIAYEMLRKIDQACSDWQQAFILGSQKAIEYLNGSVCNE